MAKQAKCLDVYKPIQDESGMGPQKENNVYDDEDGDGDTLGQLVNPKKRSQ